MKKLLQELRLWNDSQLIHASTILTAASVLAEAIKKFEDGGTAMQRDPGSPFLFSLTQTWLDHKVKDGYDFELTFGVYCVTDKMKFVLLGESTYEYDSTPDVDYINHFLTDLVFGLLESPVALQTLAACTVDHFYRQPEAERKQIDHSKETV